MVLFIRTMCTIDFSSFKWKTREGSEGKKSSCCCSFDFEYVLRFVCKYLNNICLRARKRPWVSIWKMESSFSALHSLSCIWFCSHSSLVAVHTHHTDECGTLNRSNGVFVPERASLQWENLADFYAFSLAHTHTNEMSQQTEIIDNRSPMAIFDDRNRKQFQHEIQCIHIFPFPISLNFFCCSLAAFRIWARRLCSAVCHICEMHVSASLSIVVVCAFHRCTTAAACTMWPGVLQPHSEDSQCINKFAN